MCQVLGRSEVETFREELGRKRRRSLNVVKELIKLAPMLRGP